MDLTSFWKEQGEWSEETFGPTSERGPIGPLQHLQKEVGEALAEALDVNGSMENLAMEIVDCQFLVFDAARRCGLTFVRFVELCFEKLAINRTRKWNDWRKSVNAPVEHVRE